MLSTYTDWRKKLFERREKADYTADLNNNPAFYRYGEHILDMICDVVKNDDDQKEFLADSFKLIEEVDGAFATMFLGTLAEVFEENPEKFLDALKAEPKKLQESLFGHLCFAITGKALIKELTTVPQSSGVYSLSRDLRNFVELSEPCKAYEKDFSKP